MILTPRFTLQTIPLTILARRPLCNRMTQGISYAAAVSTPSGDERQPQIQARPCSDPDMRSSYESQGRHSKEKKPQRPGAGIRAKTSFRGWAQKGKEIAGDNAQAPHDGSRNQHHTGPREEHRPNTADPEGQVYVLTLKLEDTLSQPMDNLRKQYFPKRLNRIPAHLTFFHALPHSHLDKLEDSLTTLAAETKDFRVATGGPFKMKKGVGVNIDTGYQQIKNVHAQLRSQWSGFLSEQDAGGFRPHWTVMNKVDDEDKVDNAFHAIRKELASSAHEGQAIGLDLWRYDRGNWIWSQEYTFGQDQSRPVSSKKESDGKDSTQMDNKRPGMKRGNSMADAWRSMSFRRKS